MSDYNIFSHQDSKSDQARLDKLSRIQSKIKRQEYIQNKPKWIRAEATVEAKSAKV